MTDHNPAKPVAENDETLEITDEEGQEVTEASKLKSLRDELKAVQAEKASLLEEVQRTKADFLNSKRRLEEEAARTAERNEEKLLLALLPMADSFTMARKDEDAWNAIDEAWRKGVEGIQSQLERLLESYNVTVIDPAGETFDPERHEAVGTAESESESQTVLDVVQLGYERDGTVLRAAKVVISA
jgi:molecular chaperone GrpE